VIFCNFVRDELYTFSCDNFPKLLRILKHRGLGFIAHRKEYANCYIIGISAADFIGVFPHCSITDLRICHRLLTNCLSVNLGTGGIISQLLSGLDGARIFGYFNKCSR